MNDKVITFMHTDFLLDARDPPGTYTAYFVDLHRLFCGLTPIILGTYADYFVDFPAYLEDLRPVNKNCVLILYTVGYRISIKAGYPDDPCFFCKCISLY